MGNQVKVKAKRERKKGRKVECLVMAHTSRG